MIDFRPATPEDIFWVTMRARTHDILELMAVSYSETLQDLAADMARKFGGTDGVYVFTVDESPVCILIWKQLWPEVWSMGMWATPDISKAAKYITETCGKRVFKGLMAAGCHRVECKSVVGYDTVHKWLRFLGFRQEEGIHRKFGRNGEDFVTFSWTQGMPWPRGYKPDAE